MKKYKFDSDIKAFHQKLIILKKKLPTLLELEELEKEEINLEIMNGQIKCAIY